MATINPFDLLGDDDTDDPMQLLAAHQQKILLTPEKAPAQPKPNAAQAVRDTKTESQRGGGRGRDGARGRGSNQDSINNENGYGNSNGFSGGYRQQEDGEGGKPFESRGGYGGGYRRFKDGEGGKPFEKRGGYGGGYRQSEDGEGGKPFESRGGYGGGYRQFEDGEGGKAYERRGGYGGSRGGFRGGRRGDLSNGENGDGEYPRRVYDRRSGTGRGSDFKCESSGHGNWGTPTDENAREAEEPMNGIVNDGVKIDGFEKQHEQEDAGEAKKDYPSDKPKVNKPEDKSMTLDQYEKLLEEKRKALLTSKPEERKVCLDKEFEAMQLLANKKNDDEVFRKLGSEKEEKKKEAGEKVKKTKSIHEFLKPVGFRPGGRGRGRGRGRGGYDGNNPTRAGYDGGNDTSGTGGNGVNNTTTTAGFETPSIEDVRQFPTLGSK